MRCYRKLLHMSYKDHVTNEEVRAKIQQAIGPHEDLLTIVKRRKLQWYGHVSRSSGLAKTIWQGTVKWRRRQSRQREGWKTISGNGQPWSSASPRGQWRTGKNGENWSRGAPATLSVKGWWWWWMGWSTFVDLSSLKDASVTFRWYFGESTVVITVHWNLLLHLQRFFFHGKQWTFLWPFTSMPQKLLQVQKYCWGIFDSKITRFFVVVVAATRNITTLTMHSTSRKDKPLVTLSWLLCWERLPRKDNRWLSSSWNHSILLTFFIVPSQYCPISLVPNLYDATWTTVCYPFFVSRATLFDCCPLFASRGTH